LQFESFVVFSNSHGRKTTREERRMSQEQKLAYSISDVVRISGLGRSFIYEEINAGRLKVKKAGRRTLALAADVEHWLSSLPELYACKAG
jgi:predicted DNA-binding transcriptional regulator AlpA